MGRPREAVDAAMLATPVGVDGPVETDIGRIVAGDDLAGGIERDRCLERRQLTEALPAVIQHAQRARHDTTTRVPPGVARGGGWPPAAAAAVPAVSQQQIPEKEKPPPPVRRAPRPAGA